MKEKLCVLGREIPREISDKNPRFLVVHGSHGYGLASPTSDLDVRGFYFLSQDEFFSARPYVDNCTINDGVVDSVVWEFRRFVQLALACNPTVLEALFLPAIDGFAHEFQDHRMKFMSKRLWATFGGYARGQLIRLAKKIDGWEDVRVRKDAMHCVRLIYSCQHLVETGQIKTHFDKDRDAGQINFMLSIRRGQVKSIPVYQWCEQQLDALGSEFGKSTLPVDPQYDEVYKLASDMLKREYERR